MTVYSRGSEVSVRKRSSRDRGSVAQRRHTRAVVRAAVDSLALPARCSHDDVMAAVEAAQGLPISLRELPPGLETLCGLTLVSDDAVVLHYQPVPGAAGRHNLYHELGHVVLGHLRSLSGSDTVAPAVVDVAATLLDSVTGRGVGQSAPDAGGASVFGRRPEYEAELFAYLIRERLDGSPSRIVQLF